MPDDSQKPPQPQPPQPPQRADSPTHPLWVASLSDPAWDRTSPSWATAAERYANTRALVDLIALPLVPNAVPRLYRLRPLSIQVRALVLSQSSLGAQRLAALRFALESVIDSTISMNGPDSGTPTPFAQYPGVTHWQVHDDALQAEADTVGALVLDEIADVVLHRLDLPPRRFFPFPLPLPSAMWR